jgi:hypothetical protein
MPAKQGCSRKHDCVHPEGFKQPVDDDHFSRRGKRHNLFQAECKCCALERRQKNRKAIKKKAQSDPSLEKYLRNQQNQHMQTWRDTHRQESQVSNQEIHAVRMDKMYKRLEEWRSEQNTGTHEADHIDPSEKKFDISSMYLHHRLAQEEELKKCRLCCTDCNTAMGSFQHDRIYGNLKLTATRTRAQAWKEKQKHCEVCHVTVEEKLNKVTFVANHPAAPANLAKNKNNKELLTKVAWSLFEMNHRVTRSYNITKFNMMECNKGTTTKSK